jgi:hypothetical protein
LRKVAFFSVLTVLLIWAMPGAVAQNFTVSGAGNASVNGTYIETGTFNGKPLYVQDGGSYVIVWTCDWACDGWHISEDIGGAYCCASYHTEDDGDTPPSTGWTGFDAPNPTVLPEGRNLSYSATEFRETLANSGVIGNSITITYNEFGGDFLTGSISEDYLSAGKATVTNVPAGLTASLMLTASNELTFSLTATASSHTHLDRIANLTIEFANSAFDQGNALDVFGAEKNDLRVHFIHVHTVAASGADHTTIAGALAAADNDDSIIIAAGTYTESGLTVNKTIDIRGAGADQTIVQAHAQFDMATDRVFQVSAGDTVRISDLTIRHGRCTGADADGAGILAQNQQGHFEMHRCRITRNINRTGSCRGGGVSIGSKTFVMEDCLVDSNQIVSTDRGFGGGLYVFNGGIPSVDSDIINCTFSANTIQAPTFSRGGGMSVGSQQTRVINCTVTGNSAGQRGGGIEVSITSNRSFDAINLISYGNTAPTGGDFFRVNDSGPVSGYNSIIGVSAAASGPVFNSVSSNISSADPLLAALAGNGGPTPTHAIGVGSPAIDAGLDGLTDLDQRGSYRNGTRDIGAYEYDALPVWTGRTSTDWNTASNWSTNAVPTANVNVLIPDVSTGSNNFPAVTTEDAEAQSVTVNANASLTIGATGDLTINGDLSNSGAVIVGAEGSGIGSLITLGAVSGAGAFQADQYLTGAGEATPSGVFQYVSSPVVGATSTTYDAEGTNKLWSASEAAQAFTEINDGSTTLNVGQGYVARVGFEGAYSLIGTAFNTGNVNITGLTRSGNDVDGEYGYNLIGNPYPSSVNWDEATLSNVSTTIWYRTHTAGNVMTVDTYNALGPGIGTNNNYMGTDATGIIPPGQAFWVRVVEGETTGSVSFANTMRSHGSQASIYKQEAEEGTVRLHLSNGTVSDETIVHFTTDAEDSYDDFDSQKMWMNNLPQLYTTTGTDSLTINGLYSIETNPIVDLGIKAPTTGNYTITASSITLTEEVWLEDRLLNNFRHLNVNPVYAFTTDAGNMGDRFALHFGMMTVGIGRDVACNVCTQVFAADGMVNVSVGNDITTGMITILDMAGRTVQTAAINGSRTVVATDLVTGIYLVRVETEKGGETHRVLLR